MIYNLDFGTNYSQFFIADKLSNVDIGQKNFWDDLAYKERLAVAEGILGIGTACYGPVKGILKILGSEPIKAEFVEFDHVVQASLKIGSGILQILNCPNSEVEMELKITPGTYTVRVSSSSLKIEDEDVGGDFHKFELWSSDYQERKVLKQYST